MFFWFKTLTPFCLHPDVRLGCDDGQTLSPAVGLLVAHALNKAGVTAEVFFLCRAGDWREEMALGLEFA